jgi:hypothetical protein
MIVMKPQMMDQIAATAEAALTPGKRIAVVAGYDRDGMAIEVAAALDKEGRLKFLSSYHTDGKLKNGRARASLVGVLGLAAMMLLSASCSFKIGGETIEVKIPTPRPVEVTPSPVPVTPSPAPAPSATSTRPAFAQLPPQIDMTASGQAASGIVEITQHYIVRPDLLHPLVRDEVPTLDPATTFWRNQHPNGAQAARNCDPDHYFFFDGSKSPLWWICGGSEKYGTQPRDWDIINADQEAQVGFKPFEVSCVGVEFKYPRPGASGYYRIAVGPGPGSCTVCVPAGARTPDGILMPVAGRCGTWPIR